MNTNRGRKMAHPSKRMPRDETFYRRKINEILREKGWSGSELARRAGLDRSLVSIWQSGRSSPTLVSLQKIARAAEIDVDDLMPPTERPGHLTREMRIDAANPDLASIHVSGSLPVAVALQIMQLLKNEK